MKNWIAPIIVLAGLLIYLLSLRGEAPTAESQERFAQAAAFYDRGEFAIAESEYLALIEEEQKSSAVYYNLALTQKALEQPGKAILHLEKAALLDPSSNEIETKLAELRKNTSSTPAISPPFWENIPLHWWTLSGALALLILTLLPLGRLLKFPHGPPVITTAACLIIIGTSAYAIRAHDQGTRHRAIVLAADTPLRISPFDDAESHRSLPAGKIIKAEGAESHEEYQLVKTTDGQTGWLKASEFSAISDTL
ncbi:hypothetical protein N9A94_04585 [Akkermansiaceae bacterium]|nr:hypothetical protein [Akkermansiaceae bacterium]MDA7888364.1 hypothetical protein [Akkermansiaceae bacterium]MDB4537378.1 hypothetical protein [Akkermansiaceae bacterium]